MRQRTVGAVALVALGAVAVLVFAPPTVLLSPGEYDRTTVTVHAENGTQLGAVDVRIADTREKRQVGLSRTDSLDENEGMLFVHPDSGSHTYNMRNVSVPLDIVFVAANGTVTEIHHAPAAGRLSTATYTGDGKYVLEVEARWTRERGVTPGDELRVPENVTADDSWPWFLTVGGPSHVNGY